MYNHLNQKMKTQKATKTILEIEIEVKRKKEDKIQFQNKITLIFLRPVF